jgi:hypothetical protein
VLSGVFFYYVFLGDMIYPSFVLKKEVAAYLGFLEAVLRQRICWYGSLEWATNRAIPSMNHLLFLYLVLYLLSLPRYLRAQELLTRPIAQPHILHNTQYL